jgi:hypothetical protein
MAPPYAPPPLTELERNSQLLKVPRVSARRAPPYVVWPKVFATEFPMNCTSVIESEVDPLWQYIAPPANPDGARHWFAWKLVLWTLLARLQ